MFILTTADKVDKLISKYAEGTIIFNLDRGSKGVLTIGDEKVQVPELDILPETDDIEAFLNKEISSKKVMKNLLKRVTKVREEADQLPITLYMIVKMLTNRDRKPYNIIALILPETDNSKLRKLYIQSVKALMKLFGLKVYTNLKELKGLLKGKKKKVKRNISQWISDNVYLSEKGEELFKQLKNDYKVEIASASLETILENDRKLKRGTVDNIRTVVIKALTRGKGKSNKKISKLYREFYEELEAAEDVIGELPKIKRVKKISKKAAIISLRHMAARRLGVEPGSKEYNKYMGLVTRELGMEKEFSDAMKKGAASDK